MASTLESVLSSIQQNNYVTLAMLTLVGYDYVLMFTREIEYVWNKHWSSVSTMYVLVRYCGLYSFLYIHLHSLYRALNANREFVHQDQCPHGKLIADYFQRGYVLNLVYIWVYILFLGGADLAMILRVWAMYNQSRLVLGTLLALYALEIIPIIISCAIYSELNKSLSMTIVQVLNMSICIPAHASPTWTIVETIHQLVLGVAMCSLMILQFVRQSLQAYKATKKWKLNHYVSMIVREGLLYFVLLLVFNVVNVFIAFGKTPSSGWGYIILYMFDGVPVFILVPRFIINMRELYAHDSEGGRGDDVDNGFGLTSHVAHDASPMVFANNEQNNALEQGEEIQVVERQSQGMGQA